MAVPLRNSRAVTLQGINALDVYDKPRDVDIAFTTADGTARGLSDYAGSGIVLNLWATWCVPCVAEMPSLDAFAQSMAKLGIKVLPLSSDRGGAHIVEAFYAEHAIKSLPVLLDPRSAAAKALGVRGIPTTFIIDRQGRAVASLEGTADWASTEAMAKIRQLVGESSSPGKLGGGAA